MTPRPAHQADVTTSTAAADLASAAAALIAATQRLISLLAPGDGPVGRRPPGAMGCAEAGLLPSRGPAGSASAASGGRLAAGESPDAIDERDIDPEAQRRTGAATYVVSGPLAPSHPLTPGAGDGGEDGQPRDPAATARTSPPDLFARPDCPAARRPGRAGQAPPDVPEAIASGGRLAAGESPDATEDSLARIATITVLREFRKFRMAKELRAALEHALALNVAAHHATRAVRGPAAPVPQTPGAPGKGGAA